jgi:hypothetical protein
MNEDLRASLVQRALRARQLQLSLMQAGGFPLGYHPEQEALDGANADWLGEMYDAHGWLDRDLVGQDGAAAAVQLLQRATCRPAVQRKGLKHLMEAAEKGKASLIDAAHFADRMSVFEGRAQLFGTQLDWNEAGELEPAPVKEPEHLNARRGAIGLPPIEEVLAQARAHAIGGPPPDLEARRAAFLAWAERVGWRR